MLKYIFLTLLLISVPARAGLVDDLKEKARPFLIKIIGMEKTIGLLGEGRDQIKLPEIPEVKTDAKSIENYGAEARVKVQYEEKKERQYNYSFVKDIFKAVRRFDPDKNDIAKWMNVLDQNGSREGVYRALVLDGTYLGLENHDFPMTTASVDFSSKFLAKYLKKGISEEKLQKANFFTVKRNVTEKTLEVVDELYKLKGDQIYDWYAVFSAEMAKKYPKAMDNKIRKETNARVHKKWAKSVPDQYLKSEIIIKLHKVFNIVQS